MLSSLLRRSLPTYAARKVGPAFDGRVHLVEGRRGRGKSYGLMYWAYSMWRRRIPVYANWRVDTYRAAIRLALDGAFSRARLAYEWLHDVGYVRIVAWDDVFRAVDAWVGIDEAHQYVDSRAIRDTPRVFLQWLQQSRKLGLTVVFASQSFEFVDVRVRRLADLLWQARVVPTRSGRPREFYYYGLDPWFAGFRDDVVRDHADYVMRFPFVHPVASLYDTTEIIEPMVGSITVSDIAAAVEGRRSVRKGVITYG